MKKTSKIMSLVLAGAMVLSMTACAGNTAETTAAAAKNPVWQLLPRPRRQQLIRLQRRRRQPGQRPQRVRLLQRQREPPIRLAYSSWCSTPPWTLPMTVSLLL